MREHLVRPRERVVDGRELACVVGALGGSEELGRLVVSDDASLCTLYGDKQPTQLQVSYACTLN